MSGSDSRPIPPSDNRDRAGGSLEATTVAPFPAENVQLLSLGQRFGPYTVHRLLGRGGMGEVYEAEEVESGRRVALKVLTTHRPSGPEQRERFMREGRLAAAISHPHCVYVFGTDEIGGLPVISMELATGGTLKDDVRSRGPLEPGRAVDAILQVIAGLEAAASVGVLHRDIKPANCFRDEDGTVKVGDFGLSTWTLARDETHLTVAGAIMGTPAFASPEQLRGEPLDIRSDIYSVGATLYYLLTGRAPFDDANVVRLVTSVVQDKPQPPHAIRPSIPRGLSAVVMQALAKHPAGRFSQYAALRAALEPFRSQAPTAATVGERLAALAVDVVLFGGVLNLLFVLAAALIVSASGVSAGGHVLSPQFVAAIAFGVYWTLLEGGWSASIGKSIFGLRVVTVYGQPVRALRAGLRALIFLAIPLLPPALISLLLVDRRGAADAANSHATVFTLATIAAWLLLVGPARRQNGFAGLHELVSGTRVVRHRSGASAGMARADMAPAPALTSANIGPYSLVDSPPIGPNLVAGWDPKLRRQVWLKLVSASAPMREGRLDLMRPTRLRWLAGRRAADASWDAYEALEGAPLLDAVQKPQTWALVRGWVRDLADEIRAGVVEGSLPELGFDRVWVTRNGTVKILDWPVGVSAEPGDDRGPGSVATDLRGIQQFLYRLAMAALGRPRDGAVARAPLPLRAEQLMRDLDSGRIATAGDLASRAAAVANGPAETSHGLRSLHLALSGVLPTLSIALAILMLQIGASMASMPALGYGRALEDLAALRGELASAETRSLYEAREIDIAIRYPEFVRDAHNAVEPNLTSEARLAAQEIRAHHARPSDADVQRAREALDRVTPVEKLIREKPVEFVLRLALFLWATTGVVAFLLAVCGRGGVLMRLLGLGVIDDSGEEASRLRCAARAFVAWAPVVGGCIILFAIKRPHLQTWVVPLSFATFLAGIGWAIYRPSRGVQDRIAGTYLVPR